MPSLRGNREELAVVTASLAVIGMTFAVSLARRQRRRQVPLHLNELPHSHVSQPLSSDPSKLPHKGEHLDENAGDGDLDGVISTTVVEDMRDAVPSREHIRRRFKHNVLLPAVVTVFCMLCDALLVYLVVKGHARPALFVLAITILFRRKGGLSSDSTSLSNKSKLELLRSLDPNSLNVLLREDLPRWVKFPDVEKCEWLNRVIARMWRHVKVFLARSMKEALITELELVKPTIGMTELGIRSLNFGTAGPTINGIKCLETTDEEQVVLDMDLLLVTQDSAIVLSVRNPLLHAAVNVEIANVVLRGTVRVVLKPLFPWWPTFGALSISFIEKPTIEFQLKTMHIDVMEIPALSPLLHKAVYSMMERRCLWPNKVLIPLVDDSEMLSAETLGTIHSLGVLVIRKVCVSGAHPSQVYSRWSGAYSFRLVFRVGKESTATEDIRSQNSFDFPGKVYQLLVFDPQIQDLNVALECSEALQSRKQVGNAWVRLNHLKPQVDYAEYVNFGCEGEPRAEFELSWVPFNRHGRERTPLPNDVARMGAISIKLLRCERLASMDLNGASDPYVVFRVGTRCKQSSVKKHTLNPIWDPPEAFELLVSDWQHDELFVVVMDSDLLKHDDTIGRVQISLSSLPHALRVADTWLLDGHRGSVTLELEWRSC